MTVGEVADLVGKHRSRIVQLEVSGRLPAPVRVNQGKTRVRLYSPPQIKLIVDYFREHGRDYVKVDRSVGNLSTEEQLSFAVERLKVCRKRDRPYYYRRIRYLRKKLEVDNSF